MNFDLESHMKLGPMQKGDVKVTYADTSDLERDFGWKPSTPLRDGLRKIFEWYPHIIARNIAFGTFLSSKKSCVQLTIS